MSGPTRDESASRRLYQVFNALPLLRTHVLAWIGKGVSGG